MPASYKIFWSKSALTQLDDIYDYIAEYSKISARNLTRRIEAKTKQLKKQPLIGQEEEILKELGQHHRYLVSGNYKIIYLFDQDAIFIVAVFDTRSDPASLIQKVI
jgi:toxin ParE1/3/4